MRKRTVFIGIDPGLSGAVAVLADGPVEEALSYQRPQITDTPVIRVKHGKGKKGLYDLGEMVKLLSEWDADECHVVIEEGIAMPGQAAQSTASVFYGLGLWHGIIRTLGFPVLRVRAPEWKKEFGLIGKDKKASILRAKELFPQADITLAKHDGRAEGLLIAEFGRRKLRSAA